MNIQQRMISNDLGIENNWQIVVETVDAEEIINYLPSLQAQDRYSTRQNCQWTNACQPFINRYNKQIWFTE